MTHTTLTDRVCDRLQAREQVGFAPLVLAALMGVVSAVAYWLTQRCLNRINENDIRNPGPLMRNRLNRLVRWGCQRNREEIDKTGTDWVAFNDDYGPAIAQAFLQVGAQATGEELTDAVMGTEDSLLPEDA